MNDLTRELLLKTRKGATASFETKQWGEVLTFCGFQFQTTKTRNTVTEVKITSPMGEVLTIVKEPNYRRITYYKLGSWLKSIGIDLVVSASAALGMDTPDVEKKLKDLYVRDLTNTGTCPVCEGNFKRNGTGLVHHGYTRPGDGMQHGDCFAVGYLPWELSPIGAQDYLAQALRPTLAREEAYLERLNTGKVTSFLRMPSRFEQRKNPNALPETITKEIDAFAFDQLFAAAKSRCESAIRMLSRDVTYFEKKIAAWAPDELPEVKHAGKFAKSA
jgi:hypothetical protein